MQCECAVYWSRHDSGGFPLACDVDASLLSWAPDVAEGEGKGKGEGEGGGGENGPRRWWPPRLERHKPYVKIEVFAAGGGLGEGGGEGGGGGLEAPPPFPFPSPSPGIFLGQAKLSWDAIVGALSTAHPLESRKVALMLKPRAHFSKVRGHIVVSLAQALGGRALPPLPPLPPLSSPPPNQGVERKEGGKEGRGEGRGEGWGEGWGEGRGDGGLMQSMHVPVPLRCPSDYTHLALFVQVRAPFPFLPHTHTTLLPPIHTPYSLPPSYL